MAAELISGVFAQQTSVFLAFSGGKESVVLADLCERYGGGRLPTLLWVNTGFMFPHMVEWVRSYGARFPLIELTSDLTGNWREHGLPAEILSVANAMPSGLHTEPKLQAWPACCGALRAQPIRDFMASQAGPAALIHGQRHEDRTPGNGLDGFPREPWHTVVSPLVDWSTSEVFSYVAGRHLALPPQYEKGVGSLECWVCPAAFLEKDAAARVDYMKEAYPDLLQIVTSGIRRIQQGAAGSVDQLRAMIARSTTNTGTIVPQRLEKGGDCIIAALATVTGRPYEQIAGLMGFPCDSDTAPVALETRGIELAELAAPLLSIGITSTIIVSRDAPPEMGNVRERRLPSSEELMSIVRGREAVLITDGQDGRLHAVGWAGGHVLDSWPAPRKRQIEDIPLHAAVILSASSPGDAS